MSQKHGEYLGFIDNCGVNGANHGRRNSGDYDFTTSEGTKTRTVNSLRNKMEIYRTIFD